MKTTITQLKTTMGIKFIGAAAIAAALVTVTSCQCNRSQSVESYDSGMDTVSTVSEEVQDELNKSKTILYTLPSPVEIATLIRETGVMFDGEMLNPLARVSNYTTNFQMAVNLGIYSTDMSIASMFNQSQQTMEYMNTIRFLTDKLGIVQIINQENIEKFEKKETSKDEMLSIISEVYINANQYLTENNRKNVAVMVLIGGWVEGFHLALSFSKAAGEKQKAALRERILAQKLSLATVIDILQDCNKNNTDEDLNYLYGKMMEIKMIFDEVKFETSEAPIVNIDPTKKVTIIKAPANGEVTQEIMDYLQVKVSEIRDEFVK